MAYINLLPYVAVFPQNRTLIIPTKNIQTITYSCKTCGPRLIYKLHVAKLPGVIAKSVARLQAVVSSNLNAKQKIP